MTGKSATKIVPSSIRRLTDKGSSTATRILEEAKNILVEDGFLGLSFRAIAKRTGTTVGNIGYYYGTKDDLMVDLAEYIFDRWEFRLQRDMPPSMTDRREKFRYFIRYMIDQNKQRKTMFLLLEMWAMANRSLAVSKMMDTFYGRLRDSIDGMIADLNPKMAADTRALRAALITTQIEGLMILVGPRKPKHRELDGNRGRGPGPDRDHGTAIVARHAQRRCRRRSTASNNMFAAVAKPNRSNVSAMISRTLWRLHGADQHEAQALIGCEQLTDQRTEQRGREADTKPGDDLRQRRRQQHRARRRERREAKHARGLDQHRTRILQRADGEERDRKKSMQGAERDLGGNPEPEHQQDDGIERDLGNGIKRRQDRLAHLPCQAIGTEREPERQPARQRDQAGIGESNRRRGGSGPASPSTASWRASNAKP